MTKEEIAKILIEHPNYLKERVFKKHFSEEYAYINLIFYDKPIEFKQKVYHWLHNDNDLKLGLCKICGKRTKYRSLLFGYFDYCSTKCAQMSKETRQKIETTNIKKYGNTCSLHSEETIKKKKHTWIEKYGVDNPAKSKTIQKKIKNTNLKKYGVEHPLQNPYIQEKIKNANLKKYGVDYFMQSDIAKDKSKKTCLKKYGVTSYSQTDEFKNKIRKTSNAHYGVEHPMQCNEIKEKTKQTCLKKYGVEYVLQHKKIREKIKNTNIEKYSVEQIFASEKIKEKIKETNLEKYGVPYACMRPEARNRTNDTKPNLNFIKLLESDNISYEREFHLENYSYDFKIGDNLIEINPTITHNSYINIYGTYPLSNDYHMQKSDTAKFNGYHCIHVWDWDDLDKIINMLKPKETLHARKLKLKEVHQKECNEFLNKYHLQNACKGQKIRIGLYKDDVLVQIMTFGKPRYNKNYELELLRLCSHKDYKISGGAEKIFKYILDKYNPESIISYCDNSKFNGDVYTKLGFELKKMSNPSKHWYNMKTKQHITDNLLRQRGFDQLFNTDYGKGTSNEALMLEYGFLPIYDCGQTTFVWNKQK